MIAFSDVMNKQDDVANFENGDYDGHNVDEDYDGDDNDGDDDGDIYIMMQCLFVCHEK